MSMIFLAVLAAGAALAPDAPQGGAVSTHTGTIAMADNPFRQPSTLPYRLPPFDKIGDSDYVPAFEAGMREQREEVATIARNPQPADFQNTIVALERSGQLLDRVSTVFSNLNGSNTNPELDKIDTEMTPKLTAHEDAILLDPALFARVDSLYERRASSEARSRIVDAPRALPRHVRACRCEALGSRQGAVTVRSTSRSPR